MWHKLRTYEADGEHIRGKPNLHWAPPPPFSRTKPLIWKRPAFWRTFSYRDGALEPGERAHPYH